MEKYDILTLNAKSLMWFSKQEENHPVYSIDLRKMGDSRNFSVISSTEKMGDSPFFHQILQCSKKSNPYNVSQLLFKDVIFVDFKDCLMFANKRSVIADITRLTPKREKLGGNNKKKGKIKRQRFHGEYIRGFTLGQHLHSLLTSEHGIHITFEDGKTVHFVPSDRSSSMVKASKLAYINAKYLDAMEKRLCMDMDFQQIGEIQLSKYYAYRGLYLTTSERIDFDKENVLNKETVIVLNDFKDKPVDGKGKTFFTAKKQDNSSKHDFFMTTDFNDELNLYDGEGLIDPDLAEDINCCLEARRDEDGEISEDNLRSYKYLTSIQIRGPFLKGMVHSLPFTDFFWNFGNIKKRTLMVEDAFGIQRDLLKAKLIVNESMLKCTKWLKEYCKGKDIDPMEFYFKAFHKYGHGLYVANTMNDEDEDEYFDDYLEGTLREDDQNDLKIETLNYQFLSTMDLTEDELESLVNDHFSISDILLKFKFAYEKELTRKQAKNLPIYMKAAKQNPLFQETDKIRASLYNELKTARLLCGMGKLRTTGEHRYLSSDLLAYMIDILKLSDTDINTIKALETKILDKHSFFAPCKENETEYKTEIVFERNPHLSNEDVVLRAHIADENSIYSHYGLNELTDIVMFPRASLNYMVLSSADTDGDRVSMYSNPIIVNAVKRSCYDENLDRKLPIIIIPDEGKKLQMATKAGNPDIPLIIDTFSNKVGKISNMAVTFARDELYDKKSKIDNLTARCTILTGLEIDKIKHGHSVAQDIAILEKECKTLKGRKRKDYFIERKEKISGPNAYKCTVEKLKNDNGFILSQGDSDYLSVGVEPLNNVHFTLDRLMSYYAQLESVGKTQDTNDTKTIFSVDKEERDRYKYYFTFQQDPDWEEKLDSKKLNKMKQLMKAYHEAINIFNSITTTQEMAEATNFHGKALYYLQRRYDGSDYSFIPGYSGKTVEMLLSQAELLVETACTDYKKAYNAVTALVDNYRWPFIVDKEERKKALKDILSPEIPDDVLEFMTDFRDEGYYLAYYVFKYVYYHRRAERSAVDMISKKKQKTLASNPYWKRFENEITRCIQLKCPKTTFSHDINHLCRLIIDRIFPNAEYPQEKAVKYIFSLSGKQLTDSSFLWNVISSEYIQQSIYRITTEKPEC